ncbi:MAG: phytanoyl-CoA dioxygenase family protein [Acidobacteria bacterium]|nr:phytanoyl-CoA dioxygenase family protein [Acidobacteriota bacterium]
MPATLNTKQLAARFQEDGFVVVKRFLDAGELEQTQQEIDRYIAEVLPTVPRIHVVYESGWSGPLKQFSRMELYDEYFRQALQRPATLDLLGACLGEPVDPITTEVFYKPARVGSPALYHQENAYFNYLPPYGLVMWIALDETTLENGAVHFVRGSHRLGEIPHVQTGLPLFTKAFYEPAYTEIYPEVPALLQPGDASIHHFLTIHRSGPNNTDSDRRGFVLDYRGRSTEVNQEASRSHEAYRKRIYRKAGAL